MKDIDELEDLVDELGDTLYFIYQNVYMHEGGEALSRTEAMLLKLGRIRRMTIVERPKRVYSTDERS